MGWRVGVLGRCLRVLTCNSATVSPGGLVHRMVIMVDDTTLSTSKFSPQKRNNNYMTIEMLANTIVVITLQCINVSKNTLYTWYLQNVTGQLYLNKNKETKKCKKQTNKPASPQTLALWLRGPFLVFPQTLVFPHYRWIYHAFWNTLFMCLS